MANEVEIVITSKNRGRPAFEEVKRDVTGLGGTFQKLNSTITQAMGQARDSIKDGISDTVRAAGRDAGDLKQTLAQAGQDAGTALGDGIVKGADTRLRDARGRFAKQIQDTLPSPGEADQHGRSFGSRLMSGIKDAVAGGASAIGGAISSTMKTAASVAGPVLTGVLVGVVAATLPAALATVGAVAGGALVMGIGAGFVGLGAMLLLQDKKIKEQFAATGKEIQTIMQDAAKPLLPAMEHAMAGVKTLVKEFNPVFTQAFKDAEIPLKNFFDSFLAGVSKLKPSVQPIMTAFTELANSIDWKGLFQDISDALIDLSRTVVANKSTIGAIFDLLLQAIPLVINAITGLIGLFATMQGHGRALALAWSTAFGGVTTVILGFAEKVLGVLRVIGQAISTIPGMEKIGAAMVAGIDQALAKVAEWKAAVAEASRAAVLRVEIGELTTKIDQARAKLMDPELTKERKAQINAEITQLLQRKGEAIVALGDPKLVAEYKSSINAEISTLKARLAEARKELADPNLTKERKAKLNADIAQLKAAIAQAKAAIASVQGKTVTINIKTIKTQGLQAVAHGGIIGGARGGQRPRRFRHGGISGSGSTTALVGEQGPELVRLPFGSQVTGAGRTRSALAASGGGGGHIVLEINSAGSRLDDLLVEILRRAVRVRGGNVQIALGKG